MSRAAARRSSRPYAVAVSLFAIFITSFFAAQWSAKRYGSAVEARKVHQSALPPVPKNPPPKTVEQPPPPKTVGHSPVVIPPQKVPWQPMPYLVAAPIVALWIGAIVWVARLRINVIVRDSPDFIKALDRWQPVLSQMFPTPRALKRFMNKVRVLAMLQRVEPPERTVLATLFPLLFSVADQTPAASGVLTETALVALSAIDEASTSSLSGAARVQETKADHVAILAMRCPRPIASDIANSPKVSKFGSEVWSATSG